MAISANTVFEVRTTGSDTACSGGFVTGASGTDYSQQNSAQYSLTGLTSVGAGNIILTASASADMVGNLILITAGTNFTLSTFQITSVSVGVSITVSTNGAGTAVTTGAGVAGTAVIGGALSSPGKCASVALVNGNKIWVQSGTYAISSATPNVSGGIISNTIAVFWEGYGTVRGDLGTKPVISAGINTVILVNLQSTDLFVNFSVTGNGHTAITGIQAFGGPLLYRVNVTSCATGISGGGSGAVYYCSVTGCTAGAFALAASWIAQGCVSFGNTCQGFSGSNDVAFINCIAYANTGASSHGFSLNGTADEVSNCTAYGNGGNGFTFNSAVGLPLIVTNCIAEANGGAGVSGGSSANSTFVILVNFATFNNTGGSVINFGGKNLTPIVNTTGTFFVNGASGNFAPNNTASQGALLRGTNYIGTFPDGVSVSFQDIGAVQHQDSGGGGTVIYPIFD